MNHRDVMVHLIIKNQWRTGALVGVGSGLLFERILTEARSVYLIGVDHFVSNARKKRVLELAQEYRYRCMVHVCRSSEGAAQVHNEALDFVFIDAGHKYECVRSDIRSWWNKVKRGGWFGGHGFEAHHPGVIRAITERFQDCKEQLKVLEHCGIWWTVR